ncbi:hypothetical protein [Oceanobacillus massiliensis]|uniref:hypothetical protein n=1 Tax=Oceanobacillus massiliensis TaxID=1465765 RepID=UPI0002EFB0FB|nr:hypothetical protein [Oceanobacillus massiliensis]
MDLDEQYKLYFTAYSLVTEGDFDILHLDVLANEVWLEKYENKTSKVVRLIQKGFDWKNHLRRDIANVFQKSKAMQRLLQGKHVEIYNVYVSSHAPIDDWEVLKNQCSLKKRIL